MEVMVAVAMVAVGEAAAVVGARGVEVVSMGPKVVPRVALLLRPPGVLLVAGGT